MPLLRLLLAGLLGAMVMIIWSYFMPPPLQQPMADKVLSVTPGAAFGFLIDRLQLVGKPLLFIGLTLLQLVLGAVIALLLLLARRLAPTKQLISGIALGAIAWAIARAVIGSEVAYWNLVAGFLLYGFTASVFGQSLRMAYRKETGEVAGRAPKQSRRRFLRWGIGTAGVGLAIGTGLVVQKTIAGIGEVGQLPAIDPLAVLEPLPADAAALHANPATAHAAPTSGMTPEVTPNSQFYIVSKNFIDPSVDAGSWKLDVNGPLLEHPFTIGYDDLKKMHSMDEYLTLECISNDVGGHLMSNAKWTGVRLSDLLHRAGMRSGAKYVQFTCVDNYVESLDMDRAMHPQTMVAYMINGQPLPQKHGYPARILTAGLYGMKNPKWLRSISPVTDQPQGYWEKQGWSTTAVVLTTSRIDLPKAGSTLHGTTRFSGVAYAGTRGIKRVELSFDNGKTWMQAKLEKPLSPYTWVLWNADLDVPRNPFTAQVRAIDGTGAVQSAKRSPSYPDGASGYDGKQYRTQH